MLPHTQPIHIAIDAVIFTVRNQELCVLLIQMKKQPFTGLWAAPGGLIEAQETTESAALRILKMQTGVSYVYLEQLKTFDALQRDPAGRVISTAYFALISGEGVILKTTEKYSDVRWWGAKHLPPLAYDHKEIITYARQRLAWKLEYTNVAWSLLPAKFTLSELQTVYESVLGRTLDKRNFRKKILSLNLITSLGKKVMRGAHRPAELYRFRSRKPMRIQIL